MPEFLNGKKRAIGGLLLMLAYWIPQLDLTQSWVPMLIQALGIAGTMMGGVGIVHAVQKEKAGK